MLITNRLVLRPLEDNDVESIFAIRSNDVVNEYLDRTPSSTLADAQQFIQTINKGVAAGDCYYWVVTLNAEVIGTISLWNFNEEKTTAEVGFELLPMYHGHGYMLEAVKAVIDFAYNNTPIEELHGFTHPSNISSKKLMEKIGFTELGLVGPELKYLYRPR